MSSAVRLLIVGAVSFLVSFVLAEIAYAGIAHWGWLDVVYMVIITAFGVGYGEVHPVDTPELKAWTIAIIITGCTSLILITGGFVQLLIEAQLLNILDRKKMTKEIQRMKNHVIVVGFGRVGQLLVRELHAAKRDVVIIDTNQELMDQRELKNVPVIIGDASDEETLQEAGIERATTIAVVLPQDALNVFITLSARNLNPEIEIIARGARSSTALKLKQAGANEIVLPAQSGAERIAQMILRPAAAQFTTGKKGREALVAELQEIGLDLDEITIEPGSEMIGSDIGTAERRHAFLVMALHRATTVISPVEADSEIQEGDGLIVLGHRGFRTQISTP
tara:strand:- start:1778 stop:2785 length:1008 start_codon:yes stop_codon:yes gene_type:complete